MGNRFLSMALYGLLFAIFIPGMSLAMNETIKDGDMKDIFSTASTLGGNGLLWTIENGFLETCSETGDFVFYTKQINNKDESADVIYVSMETSFSMEKKYNNSLGIYLYNGNAKLPDKKDLFKNFFFANFSLIYTVKNDTASVKKGQSLFHTFKFYQNGSNSVILAVRGVGVCGRVHSMKVYYYYCEEKYFKGVRFPKTVSPFRGWKKVEAYCSVNSSTSDQTKKLNGFCGYDGTWNISKGMGCFCNKGLELNSSNECTPCQSDHYKATSSNKSCQHCPNKSTDTANKTSCKCLEGYYHSKLNADPTAAPCFGPIKEKLKLSIVKQNAERTVKLTWSDPKVEKEIENSLHYDIQCLTCKQPKCHYNACKNVDYKPRQYNLTKTSVEISNLQPGHRYKFRVYPKTVINNLISEKEWVFSVITFDQPPLDKSKQQSTAKKKTHLDYVVVSGIACGVLFMIMVVLLIIVLKRKNEYRNHLIIRNQNQVELPYIGQKLYVDPTIYDSPEDALNEFASELDPKVLVLEKLIGGGIFFIQRVIPKGGVKITDVADVVLNIYFPTTFKIKGEFGDVYKGIMRQDEEKAMTVAVKTLKSDHTEKDEKDFLLEASVMGQFHDPNVVHLEGVVTKSFPRMIVTEYMSNGSLDRFLRLNDDNLTDLQLLGMAKGVASGMAYLSSMNFIHRDLAARNILVNDDLLCKIADFGLTRSVENGDSDGEYSVSGGKVPVRWTAPEVIGFRKFSSSSDVWSYGILLWEIMSFGERPYWDWDNLRVMKAVEEGFRLPAPKDCPTAVHNLMLSCWKTKRNERPKFEYITQVMNGWIRSPETLDEDPKDSIMGDWLSSIKMGDYTSVFLSAGYVNPNQLTEIGNDDLMKIGVKLIGHRNKILKAIKALSDAKCTRNKTTLIRAESIVV